MTDTAVIMAGGKGTRVSTLTNNLIPKPMLKINGKPILQYQIENLRSQGIVHFYICVSHLGDVIKDYFGDGKKFSVKIEYYTEPCLLGSAGALFYLRDRLPEFFFVVFGDTVFDISLRRMENFFVKKNADAVLLAHPNSHPFDSDLVICADDGRFVRFLGKNDKRDFYYDNLVNSSFFLFSRRALDYIEKPDETHKIDMEKNLIPRIPAVYCYCTSEYIKDAGTVDRIAAVERDVKSDIPHLRNLDSRQRAVFFDRDGTLNVENGFIKTPEQLQLAKGAGEAVRLVNESGFLAVVITNQPVVARGECSMQTLLEINKKLSVELGLKGAYLDALYFCPHHPDSGFEGEVKELKFDCSCRKPKIGLVTEAVKRFNVDVKKSYFIGDGFRDVQCGLNAGCKTVFLGKKEELNGCSADYYASDVLEAVKTVLAVSRKDGG